MSSTETSVNNLKINRGTYSVIQNNLSSIGENELIITTDKQVPIPTASDSGKVVGVDSNGEFELQTPSSGMSNPMTTSQDLIVGGNSGTPTRLAKGSNGQVLSVNSSGNIAWQTPSSSGMTNPMTTAGDLIIGGSSGTPTRLAKGTSGQVLKSTANGLEWANESGGSGGTQLYLHTISFTSPTPEETINEIFYIISTVNTSITINTILSIINSPTTIKVFFGYNDGGPTCTIIGNDGEHDVWYYDYGIGGIESYFIDVLNWTITDTVTQL